jgi:hypothetical protein
MIASLTIMLLSLDSVAPAGDSFLRSSHGLASTDDQAVEGNPGESGNARLREGTLIAPTPGRIVLIGRRWAFIPAQRDASTSDPLAASALPAEPPLPAASRLDSAVRSFGYRSSDDPPVSLAVDSAAVIGAPGAENGRPLGQMLISENLMLQRIVESIREDAADDRWTVSGEVSEFFDQNRLIIRTAQRASAN